MGGIQGRHTLVGSVARSVTVVLVWLLGAQVFYYGRYVGICSGRANRNGDVRVVVRGK